MIENMKENYVSAELEIIQFHVGDVITSSNDSEDGDYDPDAWAPM